MSLTISGGTSSCSSTWSSAGTSRSWMKRCTLSFSSWKVSSSSAMPFLVEEPQLFACRPPLTITADMNSPSKEF
ncbi:hypothetical protein [Ramlibacter cellulosilyticus]|uniref:hypothetical protein n=1 Tax=Ramlibacter cellulosilyticus TaxID=2764187 RepID=UPI0021040B70|nr:hypothetical protein [Ramlibacter cellulosilyticus]